MHYSTSIAPRKGRLARLAVFALIPAILAGCSKGYSRFMKLPSDSVLSTGLGWAVVVSSYVQLRGGPSPASAEAGLARKGDVFRCLESRIDNRGMGEGGVWYRIGGEGGGIWVHSSDITVFPAEERAKEEAARLKLSIGM